MSLSNKVKTAVMVAALAMAGVGAMAVDVFAVVSGPTSSNCTCTKNTTTGEVTYGAGCKSEAEKGMALAGGCPTSAPKLENTVTDVINAILYAIGILAVVMVIFGGVQYTTSGGDQAKVTKAKNTILYGIIGLVIAVLAYAIVNFVISKIG